jgi:hypothetical protein
LRAWRSAGGPTSDPRAYSLSCRDYSSVASRTQFCVGRFRHPRSSRASWGELETSVNGQRPIPPLTSVALARCSQIRNGFAFGKRKRFRFAEKLKHPRPPSTAERGKSAGGRGRPVGPSQAHQPAHNSWLLLPSDIRPSRTPLAHPVRAAQFRAISRRPGEALNLAWVKMWVDQNVGRTDILKAKSRRKISIFSNIRGSGCRRTAAPGWSRGR